MFRVSIQRGLELCLRGPSPQKLPVATELVYNDIRNKRIPS